MEEKVKRLKELLEKLVQLRDYESGKDMEDSLTPEEREELEVIITELKDLRK